ncbi:hypothetical protein [Lysinibacillus fusiformis]|uniref:hypothetical protein n=1 Tax=Lysinibacillus fusiformis TaxID=28031 RepID=UPI003AAB5022
MKLKTISLKINIQSIEKLEQLLQESICLVEQLQEKITEINNLEISVEKFKTKAF